MTDHEARETIELRAMLEGHNARLAARRQDQDVIRRIEAVLKKGVQAVANRRFERLAGLNQEFHRELYAAGQNTVLGEVLDKLRDRTAILFAPGDPVHQARNWDDHAAILRAVIDGDEHRAAGLASEHVMRAGFQYLVGSDVNELHRGSTPLGAATRGPRSRARPIPTHTDDHMKPKKHRRALRDL